MGLRGGAARPHALARLPSTTSPCSGARRPLRRPELAGADADQDHGARLPTSTRDELWDLSPSIPTTDGRWTDARRACSATSSALAPPPTAGFAFGLQGEGRRAREALLILRRLLRARARRSRTGEYRPLRRAALASTLAPSRAVGDGGPCSRWCRGCSRGAASSAALGPEYWETRPWWCRPRSARAHQRLTGERREARGSAAARRTSSRISGGLRVL